MITWALDGFYAIDFVPNTVGPHHAGEFYKANSDATLTTQWATLGYLPFITKDGVHVLLGTLHHIGYPQCYVTKHIETNAIVLFEPNSNRHSKVPYQLVPTIFNMKGTGYDTILIESILDSDA